MNELLIRQCLSKMVPAKFFVFCIQFVLIPHSHAVVYEDLEELNPSVVLKYGIIHLQERIDWLNTTHLHKRNWIPNFSKFFLEIYTELEMDEFCKQTKDFLGRFEILMETNVELIEYFAECWNELGGNGSDELRNFKIFPIRIPTTSYEPSCFNLTTTSALKELRGIGLMVGVIVSAEILRENPTQIQNLQKHCDIYYDEMIFSVHFNQIVYLDYNSFAQFMNKIHDDVIRALGSSANITVEIFLQKMDMISLQSYENYVNLIGRFSYQWGEKKRMKVVLKHLLDLRAVAAKTFFASADDQERLIQKFIARVYTDNLPKAAGFMKYYEIADRSERLGLDHDFKSLIFDWNFTNATEAQEDEDDAFAFLLDGVFPDQKLCNYLHSMAFLQPYFKNVCLNDGSL